MPTSISAKIPTIPTREDSFKRLYHALNGRELRDIISHAITEAMLRDRRFSENLTFPIVAFAWNIDLVVQPREDPFVHLGGSEGYVQVDEETDKLPLDKDWPVPPMLIQINGVQGFSDQPDNLRDQAGLPVPSAKYAGKNLPAHESQKSAPERVVELGTPAEDSDGNALIRRLEEQGKHLEAKRLRESHQSRPHKKVDSSPMGEPSLHDGPTRADREASAANRDPRLARGIEGGTQMSPAEDPRFKQAESVLSAVQKVASQHRVDPRELKARSVTIKKGGDLEQAAVATKERRGERPGTTDPSKAIVDPVGDAVKDFKSKTEKKD